MQPGIGGGGGAAHVGGTGDDEAPKDPGVRITHQSYTEKDFEGIEISSIYILIFLKDSHRLSKAAFAPLCFFAI